MTKIECVQLKDMLEASTQRKITKVTRQTISLTILCLAIFVGIDSIVSLLKMRSDFLSDWWDISLAFYFSFFMTTSTLFIISVLVLFNLALWNEKISGYKKEKRLLVEKLKNLSEENKTSDEVLSLKEFNDFFFPEKSS
jgi:hypothetical protein